jgi:hypothetical protein
MSKKQAGVPVNPDALAKSGMQVECSFQIGDRSQWFKGKVGTQKVAETLVT